MIAFCDLIFQAKRALSGCSVLGKPSEKHSHTLAALFPSSSTSSSKQSRSSGVFDPLAKSSNEEEKRKKKRAVTLSRPFKLWVVVLEHYQEKVPKGGRRKKLNDAGRVKKLEFRRTLSKQQVKNLLIRSFPDLRIASCCFYKSDLDTKLQFCDVQGSFPDGQEVTEIASKESLYIVEGSADVSSITSSACSNCPEFMIQTVQWTHSFGIACIVNNLWPLYYNSN